MIEIIQMNSLNDRIVNFNNFQKAIVTITPKRFNLNGGEVK